MRRAAPSLLSGARGLLAIAIFERIAARDLDAALVLLVVAAASDLADGALARRLDATTRAGAYLDVAADLLVVLAGFGGLAAVGAMPLWLPLVPLAAFALFLGTSGRARPVYDPLGRYFGGFLFGALAAALALRDPAAWSAITAAVLGMTAVTAGGRAAYLSAR